MSRVQEELRLRYKEFFESKLAIDFLYQSQHFRSVKKISTIFRSLMLKNELLIINKIKNCPQIMMEMREPYFGSVYNPTEIVTPKEGFRKMLAILSPEQEDLSKILQLHCIFNYRILNDIDKHTKTSSLTGKLHPAAIFSSNETRGRVVKNKLPTPTNNLGIANNSTFTKLLGTSAPAHRRAIDIYQPIRDAAFFKPAQENNVPAVAGASGHTASLMLGALLYGDLSPEDLKEYAFACFVFLAAGGNHSFYEVMAVAKLADIEVTECNYEKSIPDSIKLTNTYSKLTYMFPEFLDSLDKAPGSVFTIFKI